MKKLFPVVFALLLFLGAFTSKTYSVTGYNPVLEYCTGTWCQWCPCAETIIEGIKANYPNTMILGYHGPQGSDPWGTQGQPMLSLFGFNSYPTGVVSRNTGIISRDAWNNRVVIYSNTVQPGVSIVINNYNYNAGTHTITGSIVSTALANLTGTYFIMMELTEDNLIYPQTGNGTCPGSSTWIHKYVLKGLVNGTTGTQLATSDNWTQGISATTPLNYTFPAGVVDANCFLNIFVYKQGSDISLNSDVQQSTLFSVTSGPTGIHNQNGIATEFSLNQNYPNPFNPTTNIHFSLPKDGNASLKVYNMLGKEVAVYFDCFMKSGVYNAEVDASSWASGIYFYTLKAGNFVETKKMSLVK